jgi:hypothetical protein
MMKNKTLILFLIGIIIICIYGCIKHPKHIRYKDNISLSKLKKELKNLGDFEDVKIWPYIYGTKDTTIYIIVVEFFNGPNLPGEDSILIPIGKKAMTLVVNSIENSSDYNCCRVEFRKEKIVNKLTNNYYQHFEFSIKDQKQIDL